MFAEIYDNIVVVKEEESAMDPTKLRQGQPPGGCIILWHSNTKYNVVPIGTLFKRQNCVQVWFNDNTFKLLFNLYIPYDNGIAGDNLQEYQDILSEISVVC